MSTPLVSISCITFNHAAYLRKCLDGFLMQQTNFDFEVIINDDASTDGTQAIIQEYQYKYPDIFFPLFQQENQYSKGVRGMMAKFNFPRCRGKYIALCEGDDYWTDPFKLQKQAACLDLHDEVVLCGHDIMLVDLDGNVLREGVLINDRDCSGEELQKCHPVLTQTMFFRNLPILQNMPKETFEAPNGDRFLVSILGQYGSYKFISAISPSAYRHHNGGIWSSISSQKQEEMMALTYDKLREYYIRTNNPSMAFFHSRKLFYYSKKKLQLKLAQEKNLKKKTESIYFFLKENHIFTNPLNFLKIVFFRIQKIVAKQNTLK